MRTNKTKPMKILHFHHFYFMSLLILSTDRSSDRFGENLCQILNGTTVTTNSPSIVSFCSSIELFSTNSNSNDWQKIFEKSLKRNSLSTNDLLGFLLLFDVATNNSFHLKYLSSIDSLVRYVQVEHPFQSILTFIIHAQSTNQLYTSPLTCFNLNFLLTTIYRFVQGILFYSIDSINEHQHYHSIIAENLAGIFRPITSLREDSQRRIRNVSVEFLQLIQHLLVNPDEKFLIFYVDPIVKKLLHRSFQSALLIERGKPSVNQRELSFPSLDVWYSLEENVSSRYLLLNSYSMIKDLLEKLIIEPYEKKIRMNKAYLYWLMKKYSIEENEFYRTIEFLREILT